MVMPKVVCVGSNLESEIALKNLIANNANVIGLVTLPRGSGEGVSDYRDLHRMAKQAGIAVLDTLDINSGETIKELRHLEADYLFILGWSQILKAEALSSVSGFVVGSHPTPLPERRGRAPIPWTILDKERSSAVTLFKMSSKIDDGPILRQKWFDLPDRPTAMEVYCLAADALGAAFLEVYQQIAFRNVRELSQAVHPATYRGKRSPQDGFLDFTRSADDVDTLVRAASCPYPGAYFYYKNIKVIVWKSELYDGPERVGISGQILAKQSESLVVRADDDCLLLREFEVEGVKVSLSHFKLGDVLNYRVNDEIHELRQRVSRLENLLRTGGVSEE
ncbi:formyltransferase family protein [Guyparkeria halopsychrophila]|uniref:methionyl-tRNA formyltransferase n=1 Tax=Guyparkeria halopsychrophila TaxID=3139421 RepID=UPI0037CA81E1